MSLIIDSHQHFWQLTQPFDYRWLDEPRLATIRRDYLPGDLLPHLQRAGVDKSIFVQTQHNLAENRWALSLSEQHDFLAGIVGWVDLANPECEKQLLEFKDHPRFVGVRHVTQDEPDDDFIISPEVLRGLQVLERHGIPFDLLFYVKHLRHAATVARHCPGLRLVIDHLAKPRIKDHAKGDWLPHLRAAAAMPNIYCKLSGMVTEADWQSWQPADLAPYVQHALDLFGPSRCMFGSDWPVCELAGSYERVHEATLACLASLSPSEQAEVLGGTAARFYDLRLT